MPNQPPVKRSLFWRSRRFWYAAVVVVVLGAGGVWRLLDQVELPESTLNPLTSTSLICDASVAVGECNADNAAGQIFSGTESLPLAYEDIPLVVKQAVVASEDRKFFEHQGLDPFGIARGLYQNSKGGGSLQGGSTITQQYVKLAYLENKRSLARKVQESVLALKLERSMPKEKILENYLNKAFYGRSATGIEAAASVYFDKPAAELTASEAAFLVGLVRNPARAEPTEHQETAVKVRNSVLAAMVEEDYLDQSTYDAESKLLVATRDPSAGGANSEGPRNFTIPEDLRAVGYEYILVQARVQANELLGDDDEAKKLVDEGGVRIYTTVNPDWQKKAYEAVYSRLSDPAGDPDGAMVTLDKLGAVRVMVGGRDYARSNVNLAMGTEGGGTGRQPGSTFKAIVLAEFIKQGNSLDSTFDGPPRIIVPEANIDGTDWKVDNYGFVDAGRVTVRQATNKSVNTIFAQMMEQVTPEKVVELAAQLGLGEFNPDPSLVLGTGDVSPEALAAAYLTFDNEGTYTKPFLISRIDGPDGKKLWDATDDDNITQRQVMDPAVAQSVSSALRGVVASGSGKNAALATTQAAGKTGTTQDSRDAWFAGYTCNVANVVWMGHPEGQRRMTNVDGEETVTGSNVPARIWHDLMSQIADDDPSCEFEAANGGPNVEVGPTLERIPVTDDEGELILGDDGLPVYAGPFGVPDEGPDDEPTDGGTSSGSDGASPPGTDGGTSSTGTGAGGLTTGAGGTGSTGTGGGTATGTGGTTGGSTTGAPQSTSPPPVSPPPTTATPEPPPTDGGGDGAAATGDADQSDAPDEE